MSTTLLFLRIFNAPLQSAFMSLPALVSYSPLFILFPLNTYSCRFSLSYIGISSPSKKLAFDV